MNFHLKPLALEYDKGNFLINSDTIEFLNKSQFDFNHSWKNGLLKWPVEISIDADSGIPFIRYTEYKERLAIRDLKTERALHRANLGIDEFDFDQLNDLMSV